mgnify:CR=1 FL=1
MHHTTATVGHTGLVSYTWFRSAIVAGSHRLRVDDRGEGVISAAIVVLIMAFLGAAMWAAFNVLFDDAASQTSTEVGKIGSDG